MCAHVRAHYRTRENAPPREGGGGGGGGGRRLSIVIRAVPSRGVRSDRISQGLVRSRFEGRNAYPLGASTVENGRPAQGARYYRAITLRLEEKIPVTPRILNPRAYVRVRIYLGAFLTAVKRDRRDPKCRKIARSSPHPPPRAGAP